MDKTKKDNRNVNILSIATVFLFFCLLLALFVMGLITPDKKQSETENRVLAQLPSASVDSVLDGSFMSGFESYMSDQFLFRDSAVKTKTLLTRILGASEVNGVYIGKNDRLFEVPSEFNEDKISEMTAAINAFSKKSGIENQYFMLIPNSTYVLDDLLPDFLSCENQSEQIEKIYGKLADNMKAVDVCSVFVNAENKEDLYLKTDHHWTADAALAAFSAFSKTAGIEYSSDAYKKTVFTDSFFGTLSSSAGITSVADTLSAVVPQSSAGSYVVHNLEKQEKTSSAFDLSKLESANKYEVFFGGNFSRIVINTTALNGKKLLVFKDSYANCFIPLLTPHYETIVIIDPRYFTDDINDILADTDFTDLLYLYNVNTFLEDSVLADTLDK